MHKSKQLTLTHEQYITTREWPIMHNASHSTSPLHGGVPEHELELLVPLAEHVALSSLQGNAKQYCPTSLLRDLDFILRTAKSDVVDAALLLQDI